MRYKFLTRADINQMKANGYDPVTIEEAEEEFERLQPKFTLIAQIQMAFATVKLGDGVGLQQAQGIDRYADQETESRYRLNDEKEDWSRITIEQLNSCNSSLSFFDAAGMRFHLPAYLLAELRGEYLFGLIFTLCHSFEDWYLLKFSLFNQEQRQAVRDFLLWALEEEDYAFHKTEIMNALIAYWK
jgi:hypothetical protein